MEDEERKGESERKYFSVGYTNARELDQQCLIWTNQDARIHTEIKWCFSCIMLGRLLEYTE